MTGIVSSSFDQRLRAASAQLAEHEHLAKARGFLATDVQKAEQQVHTLTDELARDQRDVESLSSGILGFLSSLALGGELEREQREVMEAGVRLREAIASRDRLRVRLAVVDGRLAARTRSDLETEVATARAAKQAAIMQFGAPGGAELQDISIRIEAIDIELVPLDHAVAAGSSAIATLSQLLTLLDRAAAIPEHGREHVEQARGLVGEAQARLTMFYRAVEGLGASDEETPSFASMIVDEDRQHFVDGWIKQLFRRGERAQRIELARSSMWSRLERAQAQLAPVRMRRDKLAAGRAQLVELHDRLLEPRPGRG